MVKTQKTSGQAVKSRLWVTRHYPDGTEISDERDLEVQTFESEPAYVRVAMGLTINTGNYNSARLDAGLTLPTYVEEIPGAYAKAWEIVEAEVKQQSDDLRKGQKGR